MQIIRRGALSILILTFAALPLSIFAQQVIDTVPVGQGPGFLSVDPLTNKIYESNYNSGSVTVVDGATDSTTDVPVGTLPAFTAVDPVTNKIYVSVEYDNKVTVIDGVTLATTSVPVNSPQAMAVNPVTNKIYNINPSGVTVIDGVSLSTTFVAIAGGANDVAVNKTTNKIYMPNYSANTVTVMDGLTLFTTSVPSQGGPVAVAVNETTNKIYVTNSHAGTVTVIDGATLSTTTVTVGGGPDVVAVNAVTNKVYVANNNPEPTVTVIDGVTLSTVTLSVVNVPRSVAVNAVTNKVYFLLPGTTGAGGMVTIIDGATNSTTNLAVESGWGGPNSIAVNPVTNRIYVTNFDINTVSVIDGTPPTALQFVPLTPPCRAVDTRPQYGGGGPIQGFTHQDFLISGAGNCGVLASAAAYSMNISVVPEGFLFGLTVWPKGQPRPLLSMLESDGRIKANAAIVPAGASGEISVYANNTTNVIVDVDGYFAPVSSSTLAFYPLPPCRVADTRHSSYPQGLGPPFLTRLQERAFPILNATTCNIPSSAAAYSLNFSVVPHGPLGYMTVWPTGEGRPVVSTLTDIPGTIIANAAIVTAGTGGKVSVYPTNDTDLVIDINGYFAAAGPGGLSLYGVRPCEVGHTNWFGGWFGGTLSPPVDVVDTACNISSLAQAYVFNAQVWPWPNVPLGYLTLWPDGTKQPFVSTLNDLDESSTFNMAIVPNQNGSIDAYASGVTQLILDISSYFAP